MHVVSTSRLNDHESFENPKLMLKLMGKNRFTIFNQKKLFIQTLV